MDQFYLTLHQVGLDAKGGITGMAKRLAIRAGTLTTKLDPTTEAAEPKVSELIRIMRDANDTSPLDELCRMFDGRFMTKTQEMADSLIKSVLEVGSKQGDLSRCIEEAIDDDVIDPKELSEILEAIREAGHAIEVLRNTVKEKHERGLSLRSIA